MNELTIAIKGKTCWYCGRKLLNSDITIDHLYPQDLGGPYITNNLAPTCSECNGRKGNLTERQYRNWLAAPSKQKGEIKKRFLASNMRQKRKKGYYCLLYTSKKLKMEEFYEKRISNKKMF